MCRCSHFQQALKASYSLSKKLLLTGVSLLRQTGVNLHRQAGVSLNRQTGVNFVVFCTYTINLGFVGYFVL